MRVPSPAARTIAAVGDGVARELFMKRADIVKTEYKNDMQA